MKSNQLVYIALAIVLLAGLFFLFKPKQESQTQKIPPAPQFQTQSASPSEQPESNIKTFELVIKQKELVSGSETLKINEGDQVVIKVTADEAEEFHIHGYDNFVDLLPNQQKELKFTANLTGRFIFELEKSKTDLGALEVSPKQ